jgi:hypothetical protein
VGTIPPAGVGNDVTAHDPPVIVCVIEADTALPP